MAVIYHGWSEYAAAQVCAETETWVLPVTVNCYNHVFFCFTPVKGPIKTSPLTTDCHQQFASSPKQSYIHFLNGFTLPDYPLGMPNESHVE